MESTFDYETIIAAMHVDAPHASRASALKMARQRINEIDREISRLNAVHEGIESIIQMLDVEDLGDDPNMDEDPDAIVDEDQFLSSLDDLEDPPISNEEDWSSFDDLDDKSQA